MEAIGTLLEAISLDTDDELDSFGVKIGHLYTDHGLPIDMAFDKLNQRFDLTSQQKLAVLNGALWWLVQHRRNSAATEKALDRQRKINRETVERFIRTGEVGLY